MTQPRRTRKAVRECAEWLATCVRLGWHKDDFATLEALWWKYHDWQGKLIATRNHPYKSVGQGSCGECGGDRKDHL